MPPHSVTFERYNESIVGDDSLYNFADFFTQLNAPQPIPVIENLPFNYQDFDEDYSTLTIIGEDNNPSIDLDLQDYQPTDATYSPINPTPSINFTDDDLFDDSPVPPMDLYDNVFDNYIPSRYIRILNTIEDADLRQELLEDLRDRELRNTFESLDLTTPEGIDRARHNVDLDISLERRLLQIIVNQNDNAATGEDFDGSRRDVLLTSVNLSDGATNLSDGVTNLSDGAIVNDNVNNAIVNDNVNNSTPRRAMRTRTVRRFNPLSQARRRLNFENL